MNRDHCTRFWSAPAERSDDGALEWSEERRQFESGVALRLPPHSKTLSVCRRFMESLSIGQINPEILIDRIFFSGGRCWNAAQIAIGHQVLQIPWRAPLFYGAFPDRLGQFIEHRGDL